MLRSLVFSCALLSLALAGCTPASLLGVEEVTPDELQRALGSDTPPLLVDVTTRAEFEEGHLPGALHVPLADLPAWRDALLRRARDASGHARDVVLVCRSGKRSAAAASHLAGGESRVRSLAGGKLAWVARGGPLQAGAPSELVPAAIDRPLLALSIVEQVAAVAAGLVVKPAYMLLALLLALALFRSPLPELALLRNGLLAFFAGELACATNYLCASCTGETLETLHGLGMLGMGALASWGLFRLVDERMIGLTSPGAGCSLRRFCRHCWKQESVPCLAQRVFRLTAPALAIVALIPFGAPLRVLGETGLVFGTPVPYSYSLPQQLLDFRLYPALAAACFGLVSVLLLGRDRRSLERVQPLVFSGCGLLSFALFRFFLFSAFRTRPVWLDFWEELTELFAIVVLAVLAWSYREGLGLVRTTSDADGGGGPAGG